MQEAAECVSGKNGVPKGYKGAKGIVILSNDASYTYPEDIKKKKEDEDEDDDEGSETSSLRPRNLSYSSQSERGPKSPAKRKKKAAWPPRGGDEEEDEEEIQEEDEMMMMMILGATTRTRGLESPSIMSSSMSGS